MKKSLLWLVVVLLSVSMVAAFSLAGCKKAEEVVEEEAPEEEAEEVVEEEAPEEEAEEAPAEEPVTIIVTSWRTEDIEGMKVLHDLFTKEYPNIKVEFASIKNTEYFAQLATALETGTNIADVISLQSFGSGKKVYEGGYLVDLNELIPEIDELNLTVSSKNGWAEGGVSYAVPWCAVSIGIYYNKEIFDKYGLEEPELWSEFIAICDTLKAEGETVFAQGSKDAWTLDSMGYSNYGCNFYGGEKSRQKLMAGEMKVTDEPFVRAFEAMDSLTKYYPEGYQAIDYVSSQQMFVTGQAAIFLGGSWEITPFKNMGMEFECGWFPPPVENQGDTLQYCFPNGSGIAMYKDTPHPDEVITYLKWLLTPIACQTMMNEMEGFYTYVPGDYKFEEPLAEEMFKVTEYADLCEFLPYEKLSDQEPAASTLFYEAEQKLANGEYTPEEAAKHVQDGLETWYEFK